MSRWSSHVHPTPGHSTAAVSALRHCRAGTSFDAYGLSVRQEGSARLAMRSLLEHALRSPSPSRCQFPRRHQTHPTRTHVPLPVQPRGQVSPSVAAGWSLHRSSARMKNRRMRSGYILLHGLQLIKSLNRQPQRVGGRRTKTSAKSQP